MKDRTDDMTTEMLCSQCLSEEPTRDGKCLDCIRDNAVDSATSGTDEEYERGRNP